jgi:anti-anti-sigma factor
MDRQESPVTVSPIPDGLRLGIMGPIHINTSWLERELDKVVAQKPKLVEVDLRDCEYISSHGLGVVIGLFRRITDNGGKMKVVAIQKRTFAIFKLSRLDQLLGIEQSAILA